MVKNPLLRLVLAETRLDLKWYIISLHRDVAAGVVIIREAGGLVFDP